MPGLPQPATHGPIGSPVVTAVGIETLEPSVRVRVTPGRMAGPALTVVGTVTGALVKTGAATLIRPLEPATLIRPLAPVTIGAATLIRPLAPITTGICELPPAT